MARLQIKPEAWLTLGQGSPNIHQLSMKSMVTYATLHRYFSEPEKVETFDIGVFSKILLNGCRLSADEVLNLKLGDLFDVIDE